MQWSAHWMHKLQNKPSWSSNVKQIATAINPFLTSHKLSNVAVSQLPEGSGAGQNHSLPLLLMCTNLSPWIYFRPSFDIELLFSFVRLFHLLFASKRGGGRADKKMQIWLAGWDQKLVPSDKYESLADWKAIHILIWYAWISYVIPTFYGGSIEHSYATKQTVVCFGLGKISNLKSSGPRDLNFRRGCCGTDWLTRDILSMDCS